MDEQDQKREHRSLRERHIEELRSSIKMLNRILSDLVGGGDLDELPPVASDSRYRKIHSHLRAILPWMIKQKRAIHANDIYRELIDGGRQLKTGKGGVTQILQAMTMNERYGHPPEVYEVSTDYFRATTPEEQEYWEKIYRREIEGGMSEEAAEQDALEALDIKIQGFVKDRDDRDKRKISRKKLPRHEESQQ